MNIKSNSSTGYILEVDLDYLQELHNIPNDYTLAQEKINILKEWLSDYSLEITNAQNITTRTVKRLVSNLMNKNNYVIHYRNLQQCLELGMKLKKLHRVLKFKQKDWMKPYIDFNTQKRKEATNEANKNHFKLSNNAVYGKKKMENMRKRIKIRVVKNVKGFIRYASRSRCYELHEKSPYRKMYKYKEVFDLSNFPGSSKYYCSDNKKVLGKIKDEYSRKSILKFVGPRSKMYSILDESNNEKITSKGRNDFIEFQEFYDTLFEKKTLRHTMRRIGSKNHNLGTYKTNKRSL